MKNRIFTVILYKEDDLYIAECPEVGTVDQGETIEQAIAGLKEATRLYLEEFSLPETSTPRVLPKSNKLSRWDNSQGRLAPLLWELIP